MIGPLVLVIGLLGLWALARGKAGPVIDAITGQTGFSTSLDNALGNLNLSSTTTKGLNQQAGGAAKGDPNAPGSGPGGINDFARSLAADIGTHSAIDPGSGLVVTIDKTYAQMSQAEKSAANAYANRSG